MHKEPIRAKGVFGTAHPFFEKGPVFGRVMANAGFLNALLRADPFPAYHFFIRNLAEKTHLEKTLQAQFPALWESGKLRFGPLLDMPACFAQYSYACFHLSDWREDFINAAVIRNVFSPGIFPITAPVHSLSPAFCGPGFLRHIWGGVSSRDRIIATSTATEEVIGGYFAQLAEGYGLRLAAADESGADAGGAPLLYRPGVTRLPLGVDPEDFAPPETKRAEGAALRARLGLAPGQTLFLSFSRVSNLSKMDFLPVLEAFRLAAARGLDPAACRVVIAGRVDKGDPYPGRLERLAKDAGVPLTLLTFPEEAAPAARRELFAAADVFLSPVDNIQETFGLTLLEAGAASLPVAATDFDGYRDLVRHGETGFLIPSVGPASAEASTALAALLLPNHTHFLFAQQCVVDIDSLAEALVRLGSDPVLRLRMGMAGRRTVLQNYTWDLIVERSLTLWEELAARPLPPGEEARLRAAKHPSLPDICRLFSGYWSRSTDDPALAAQKVRTSAAGRDLLAGRRPFVVYELLRPVLPEKRLLALLRACETPVPFGLAASMRDRGETGRHDAPEKGANGGGSGGDAAATGGIHSENGRAEPEKPTAARRNGGNDRREDRDFLVLWALKHGLLEFEADGSG